MTFKFFSWIAAAARRCMHAADTALGAPVPRTCQFGLLVGTGPMIR